MVIAMNKFRRSQYEEKDIKRDIKILIDFAICCIYTEDFSQGVMVSCNGFFLCCLLSSVDK